VLVIAKRRDLVIAKRRGGTHNDERATITDGVVVGLLA